MKNRIFVLSTMAVAALALVSCAKEQEISIEIEPKGVPFEIVASSIDTKTVNDEMKTLWVVGDQINLFHAVNGEDSYVNDGAFEASSDGASVSFTGNLYSPLADGYYDWFAVYPYAAGFDTPAGTKTITIPAAQTQTGNDSKAHLAGANCPVAGNVKNVAHDATPTVAFKHLTSIIRVHVTNKTASAVTVEGVSITAPVNINGAYNLTLTGDSPSLSGDGGSATTSLTVSGASALASDGSADFYMAVKPFAVSAGQEISLTVSTDAGDQTLTTIMPSSYTFAVRKIATLNFNYTNKEVTLARFKYNDADWLDAQSITKPASGNGTNLTGSTQTVDEIALSSTDGSTATRVYNSSSAYDLRVYKNGGSFTLSASDDYIISKIAVTESGVASTATFGTDAANVSVSCGTKTGNTKNVTWTGLSQDVIFSACTANTLQVGTITVFYQAKTASDHVVSLPIIAKGVAYSAGSTTFSIRTVNVDDLVFSSTSPGCSSNSYDANTLTVNYTENTGADSRDIVVNVTSASAGFAGTLTITQDGAPTKINTLTSSSVGVTVTGQVTALTTKGFVLTDDTASIYVYLNATPSAYSIGQTVTIAGDVEAYSKGLQFKSSSTITPGAPGSYVYPSPAAYGLAEVTAFNADASNRLATYVQFNAVVDHSSSYYNVYIGGTSAINATLYYAPSTFTSGLVTGDYVTVKGYAAAISAGKMAVYVTELVESDTAPALIFSDIVDVAAAGASSTLTITPFRTSESTATILSKPDWVTAASINSPTCTTLSYTVSASGSSVRSGEIVIRITKSAVNYDYTVKINQLANLPSNTFTFNTSAGLTALGISVPANDKDATDLTGPYTSGNVTMAVTHASTKTRIYNAKGTLNLRIYKNGGSLAFSVPAGKLIKSIAMTGSATSNFTANVGTFSAGSWSGSAQNVTLSASNTGQIDSITVSYDNE